MQAPNGELTTSELLAQKGLPHVKVRMRLPFAFEQLFPTGPYEKNLGQAPLAYRYLSRHGSIETLFSPTSVDFVKPTAAGPAIIHLRLLGSRADVSPEGRKPLGSVTNYLIGNDPARWLRGVSNDSELAYPGIYPGIELAFHGNGDLMEHDFRIAPGADPNVVRFVLEGTGAENVFLDRAAGK